MNVLNDSTTITTPITHPLVSPLLPSPIATNMTNLLKLINNLALSNDPPKDTPPKSTDVPTAPFTFKPNPSVTLDIPPPPSPNPFQPPGPDYGWGNE
ncbi:hypothetical protein JAAARDRAFT_192293 [Jaapia argillacea MUCL 33604]|uniref:Uncharacterized protein n=1 Tax=Jaapia argillacea MUCL 33604 TaxID=933084 RepID=A0A067Q8K2_9AGAM|nr:hypothetical protein JAAARDRAFT_192293 [Jaapia argillacea MUCL 33604]